ncbi:MAG TPA: hypothetical protein VFN88_07730 [Caulobacteraceae bacterium]|nr:hypothetical protein [Caulobacteraceae bacterium]
MLTSWWLDAMVLLQRRLEAVASGRDSGGLFDRMERFHRIMLAASLLTLLGAVGGSHGLFAQ